MCAPLSVAGNRVRHAAGLALACALVAACQPPAADNYVTRTELTDHARMPSPPAASPDVTGAVWAPSGASAERLLYGIPGEQPLLALECARQGAAPSIMVTRYVRADAEAKALMALVGTGPVLRMPVDAVWNGRAWIWQGAIPATEPRLAVFAAGGPVRATVPGGGAVELHSSPLPTALIARCAGNAAPETGPSAEQAPPPPAP